MTISDFSGKARRISTILLLLISLFLSCVYVPKSVAVPVFNVTKTEYVNVGGGFSRTDIYFDYRGLDTFGSEPNPCYQKNCDVGFGEGPWHMWPNVNSTQISTRTKAGYCGRQATTIRGLVACILGKPTTSTSMDPVINSSGSTRVWTVYDLSKIRCIGLFYGLSNSDWRWLPGQPCVSLPEPQNSCVISGDIILDHLTQTASNVNGHNTSKWVGINCSKNQTAKFYLISNDGSTNGQITLKSGSLISHIAVNNQSLSSNGLSVSLLGGGDYIKVGSTLRTIGIAPQGRHTGSAVLVFEIL
ncbi:MrpH family fimbial adhesin [Pseudomonas graminis]